LRDCYHLVDVLINREQKVEDDSSLSSHLGNYRHKGDLEVSRQVLVQVFPEENPAEAGLDLVLDVLGE
jgi:hypothetical protein